MEFSLAYSLVGEQSAPRRALFLHGILGAGHNFRSFAKRLVALRPDYCCVLVDLRNHGGSLNAPPPHSLTSAATDLKHLARTLGGVPDCVLGHSFGGKVALRYAEAETALPQVWALDTNPGSQLTQPQNTDSQVWRVLRALRALNMPQSSRASAEQALLGQGLPQKIARWLTTNLQRKGDEYIWSLDLSGIEALMQDYVAQDLWPFLERTHAAQRVELVIAENSDHWDNAMRLRAQSLAEAGRLRMHLLPDSGHWVHIDNPDELLRIIAEHLVGHVH